MAKVQSIKDQDGNHSKWYFICPACGFGHWFDDRWSFNGDVDQPTFKPSLLLQTQWGKEKKEVRCHSYVTDGQIRFLNDCSHDMAGKTIELPEIQ